MQKPVNAKRGVCLCNFSLSRYSTGATCFKLNELLMSTSALFTNCVSKSNARGAEITQQYNITRKKGLTCVSLI